MGGSVTVRSTYTYAVLDISAAAFEEIRAKLAAAGYQHAFHESSDGRTVIDMHGIAVAPAAWTQCAAPADLELIPVESSNVAAVGWRAAVCDDRVTGILRVQFRNGSVYDYERVPCEWFVNLLHAPSKGALIHSLKAWPSTFPCRKVEARS